MTIIRSLIFNVLFYVVLILYLVLGSWLFFCPRIWAIRGLQAWASTSVWMLKIICNIDMEVRGLQHVPRNSAVILAGKHQSLWETFALLPLVNDPCVVLKKELTYVPLFGWFALKFQHIAVARDAGSSALRNLVARGKREIAEGRQIIILPEGTRQAPDAAPDYKSGAAALYVALNVDCVPFGLNAGLFWPRRKFMRYPGTIVVEFCPAIPAGLPRKEFQSRLQMAIETSTAALVAEARSKIPPV